MSANVIVYSTSGCSDCNQVKQLLTSKGVPFEVRDVMASAAYQDEVEQLGFMGIPVTVYGGRAVKGFNLPELQELIDAAAE
ncbi:glutaredoxin family protein [Paenibacillus sp. MMS20-IR301]|uniref:glutaredoxin family protein n=1 Tax=Paenibacillus sp. MMS20-IR301 TaxID=2895946 RepID=UPI0028E54569|nr:glutaredoxin family protein [Paenibacillus sp. MMS20-IR301]WNS41707.1 glutaredoxin family protein [Paenibacillus sp. MMS20-IR301]